MGLLHGVSTVLTWLLNSTPLLVKIAGDPAGHIASNRS